MNGNFKRFIEKRGGEREAAWLGGRRRLKLINSYKWGKR